jgi:alkylation response protein AidB-like acyl-CoA dehydrogenase
MDFQLSDEQAMIQRTARRIFAEICPRHEVRRLDAADEFPAAVVKGLGDAGLLGLTIDPRYGGGGPETLGALLVIEEAARASGAIGFAVTLFLSYGGRSSARSDPSGSASGSCRGSRAGNAWWRSRSPSPAPAPTWPRSARPRRSRAGS